ncbi:uncharacterized protein SPAPADRAFT_50609 [Spathaspora passalidarum NRRL Y-27907]|uniref:Uncharacterized protein n=1 Tax=Spathaspora passalidarum (strain NRRL Y-27907 / 11-Y1) TaxID=619300 RepID=G3ANS1_SPAPN|nr:uncharacterized protein SPAPADRAFT_50609 [Spathaspora passalidarum NRRL Y-27907]EGW32006.1 hypothetical protein SPAPADRAFT_50609 [Spathaspora passalidarum NRRL Y-27907]
MSEEAPPESETIAEILFNNVTYQDAPDESQDYSHVELLLQLTPHSNKHYVQFQSHNRQFINLPSDENQVYRWNGSCIALAQSAVLDHWSSRKAKQTGEEAGGGRGRGGGGGTSMLFSWSSTDASIEARRAKLNKKGPRNNSVSTAPAISPTEQRKIDILQKLNISGSTSDSAAKLSRIVEAESAKFMHARVKHIRTRHSEQMNKLITERKKKDHELHLQKLKQMEIEQAELARALAQQPPESKSSSSGGGGGGGGGSGGLLGLFGFGGSNSTVGQTNNRTASSLQLEQLEQAPKTTKTPPADDHKGIFGLFGSKEKEKQTKSTTLFERGSPAPAPPQDDNFIRIDDLEKALGESSSQLQNITEDNQKKEEEEGDDDDDEFSNFASAPSMAVSSTQQSTHQFLGISGEIQETRPQTPEDNLLDL